MFLKIVSALILVMALGWPKVPGPQAAETDPYGPMTPADAAKLLVSSVVEMSIGSRGVCTASKIGPSTFLTAAHCARRLSDNFRLNHGWDYQYIKEITIAVSGKPDGSRKEDWAILHTTFENKELKSLQIGCNEKVYLGMPVAYAGYPGPVDFAFGLGYVTSVNKITKSGSNADFLIDVQAAAGASGSPVISLDTGRIIGILTEGIRTPARGFFLVGIESIRSLNLCDGKADKVARPALNSPF